MNTPRLIKDIMSNYPIWINHDENFKQALHVMDTNMVSHLPVCADRKVVGIISKSDLLKKALQLALHSSGKVYVEKTIDNMLAVEFMTIDPIVIKETETEDYAKSLMIDNLVHALPVIDEQNEISGVISFYDLIK